MKVGLMGMVKLKKIAEGKALADPHRGIVASPAALLKVTVPLPSRSLLSLPYPHQTTSLPFTTTSYISPHLSTTTTTLQSPPTHLRFFWFCCCSLLNAKCIMGISYLSSLFQTTSTRPLDHMNGRRTAEGGASRSGQISTIPHPALWPLTRPRYH